MDYFAIKDGKFYLHISDNPDIIGVTMNFTFKEGFKNCAVWKIEQLQSVVETLEKQGLTGFKIVFVRKLKNGFSLN